jgi:hypothetical protein
MFDELEQLQDAPAMQHLLGQYAQAGGPGQEAWQERLMRLDGVESDELVQWHGALLAAGWVELNVGHRTCCYRATAAGGRALQQVRQGPTGEDDHATPTSVGNDSEPAPDGGAGTALPRQRQRRKPIPVTAKDASFQ